jgi:hypothetical protein
MKLSLTMNRPTRLLAAALTLAAGITGGFPLAAAAAESAGSAQQFSSPEAAVKALVAANKAGDRAAVDAIFGPEVKDLLSGDPRQDAIEFAAFAKSLAQYHRLVRKADDRYVLNVGAQNWPFPIPIVKRGATWAFDTAAGKDEIVNRRIGEDELATIEVCRTYVTAQREYASEDRDGSGVFQYAQRIKSTPGKKDGLYWPMAPGEDQSPFGPLVAEARAEGYGPKPAGAQPEPFHGYFFKILTAQSPAAAGGAYDYMINGDLLAGFALVAYPAHWGESGVMTFMVNQWGKVYQCNLGAQSADIAAAMTEFDPGPSWELVAP